MVKRLSACSPVIVALSMAAAAAQAQTPAPAQPATAQQVTVVGCVARNGAVDIDKGVRVLDTEPNGLALTGARLLSTGGSPASAVPGSIPDGRDTGTIPQQTIVNDRPAAPAALSFALSGASLPQLGEQVGRRVEIVGRVAPPSADGAGRPLGTSGSTRGAGTAADATTREERPAESAAHPSADLRKLEVISFRSVSGACE